MGGQTVADGLLDAGAARVFAAAGAAAGVGLGASRSGLDVVEVASVSLAGVMAAVTGELRESPGVLVLAPGTSAEAAPALAYAFSSGAPLLVVTGDPLHRVPGFSMKASIALAPESMAPGVAAAARLAGREPCGPVHLLVGPAAMGQPAADVGAAARPVPPAADPAALDEAAERLAHAAHPVLLVGSHCRTGLGPRWIRALAETMPAPVLLTPKARGVLPDPHPLAFGEAASLLERADLVVAIGIDPRETRPWRVSAATPLLHLGATPPPADWIPAARVLGDVGTVIEELAPRLRGRSRADWDVAELDRLKRAQAARAASTTGPAERAVAIVRESTPAGTMAAADETVAAAVRSAWQAVGPSELLTATPGLPGFAPAAAFAARLARPERPAVAFIGAAGLPAADAALALAGGRQAPIIVIVLGETTAGSPLPPRAGMACVAAPTPSALVRALTGALAAGAPCLIDARSGRASTSSV